MTDAAAASAEAQAPAAPEPDAASDAGPGAAEEATAPPGAGDTEPPSDASAAAPVGAEQAEPLSKQQFQEHLFTGGRVLLSVRFTEGVLSNKIDAELARLLASVNTIVELNQLAPAALRRELIGHLLRFYRRGL